MHRQPQNDTDDHFSLSGFLQRHRAAIIEQWIIRLHTECGPQYGRRPLAELRQTISEAFDANFQVLVHDNFAPIDGFIDKITRLRLETGFLLSDVQKAFELFRCIVIPLLAGQSPLARLSVTIQSINRCLAYTIHRFSDHFQDMHQKNILEHNRRLEETVRRRTAALEESELRYKTLVEEINDGYVVIQNQSIVFANEAFCRMHGHTSQEVVGRRFIELVAAGSRRRVQAIYQDSMQGKMAPRVFEYDRLTRDGHQFPTEIQAKNTLFDNRISSIGICRDITDRVKMEQRIRENERMAYIGQITTSLSHEIRNPLSAIKLNLQVLKKNPLLKGNDQRRITISVEEVMRLEQILNQLLNFAKPVQLNCGCFSINTLVADFTELLEVKFKEKNLKVALDFQEDLTVLRMDKEKLGQALINILINAIDASEPDATITVSTLRLDAAPPVVQIVIEDEGCGLPAQLADDIFTPFITTKSKGTGLGLSNARRIVEAHGGWLRAENRVPAGAKFTLCLPLGEDHGQSTDH
jgi:PAS domain S-box-containing protein